MGELANVTKLATLGGLGAVYTVDGGRIAVPFFRGGWSGQCVKLAAVQREIATSLCSSQ